MVKFLHTFALLCTLHHFNFEHGDHAAEVEFETSLLLRHATNHRSISRAL